jgi:hypothetical protein
MNNAEIKIVKIQSRDKNGLVERIDGDSIKEFLNLEKELPELSMGKVIKAISKGHKKI